MFCREFLSRSRINSYIRFSLAEQFSIFEILFIPVKHLLLILLIGVAGCTYIQKQGFSDSEHPDWHPAFDSSALSIPLSSKKIVTDFYQTSNFRYVWQDSSGLKTSADSMISIIRTAENFGLISADYHREQIDELVSSYDKQQGSPDLDVLLTDAFFTMRLHLKYGRVIRKTLERIDYTNTDDSTAASSIKRAISGAVVREMTSQEPPYPIYQKLKQTLQEKLSQPSEDSAYIKQVWQLTANMERWRLQKPMAGRRIVVNVPSFMLQVIEGDSVVLESKVIIGKPETPTPELESVIRSFIIYPYWHVPKSIVKEILPQIQADSLYLRKHNYEVLDNTGTMIDASTLDWSSFGEDNFPYVLRQREGYENTMGVLKFVFANNYNVYLHDTNAKRLFGRDQRALSHGCVRVNKAVQLAHYLAKDDDTYVSPEDLDQYLLLQHRLDVEVVKPIALYLQYFTCVEREGHIVILDDLYQKDKKMIEALETKSEGEPNL